LEASQKQLQEQQANAEAEQNKLKARAQELQAAQDTVEQQVKRLTESLAEETKRRESAEKQTGEFTQRRSELEARMAQLGEELQKAQKQVQAEAQVRQELQQAQGQTQRLLQLAESQRAQVELKQQLEEAAEGAPGGKREFPRRAIQAGSENEGTAGRPSGCGAENLVSHPGVAEETKRREGAEQHAGEIGERRKELEAKWLKTNRPRLGCNRNWTRFVGKYRRSRKNSSPGNPRWNRTLRFWKRPRLPSTKRLLRLPKR
jgi:hypothetical protein